MDLVDFFFIPGCPFFERKKEKVQIISLGFTFNSVFCYASLYIMKCKIQEKQIASEGFLNELRNEGVLWHMIYV